MICQLVGTCDMLEWSRNGLSYFDRFSLQPVQKSLGVVEIGKIERLQVLHNMQYSFEIQPIARRKAFDALEVEMSK